MRVVFIISGNVVVMSVRTSEAWLPGRGDDACYLEPQKSWGKAGRSQARMPGSFLSFFQPPQLVSKWPRAAQTLLGGGLMLWDGWVCQEQLQHLPVHLPSPGPASVAAKGCAGTYFVAVGHPSVVGWEARLQCHHLALVICPNPLSKELMMSLVPQWGQGACHLATEESHS